MTSIVAAGFKALAFAALNKSDTLNAIVNRLSGGSVNRDTLAQSVLRDALQIGGDYAVGWKSLGERSAQLVPLVRDALVDNDLGRMKGAVEKLATEFLGEGLLGSLAGKAGAEVGAAVLGDHALEKVLATHVKQHGWKPLDDYLRHMLSATPGGNFIAGQFRAVLERTLAKPEFDTGDNAQFRLLAGELNAFLTDGDYARPLREYAPRLMAVTDALTPHVKTLRDGVDSLAERVLGPPQSCDSRQAYGADIERARQGEDAPPPTLTSAQLTPQLPDRDIAETLVRERVVAQSLGRDHSPTGTVQVQVDLALQQGRIDETRHEEVTTLVDRLSDAQLLPLGERGGVEVAHTPTGRLDRVEAQSHLVTGLREDLEDATRDALALAPRDTTTVNNFVVGKGYAQHAGKLELTLPRSSYGYTDSALEGSRSLMNFGWGMVGGMLGYGGQDGPSHKTGIEVRQLYNTCGGDERMLGEVTRFLDPEVARAALVAPTLEQMRDPGTGLVSAGGVQLELHDAGKPEFRFDVQRVGDMVTVSLEAIWTIDRFGPDAGHLRKPEGDKPSQMKATAVITIRPNPDGGAPIVAHFPMGVLASVNNVLQFDLGSGGLSH